MHSIFVYLEYHSTIVIFILTAFVNNTFKMFFTTLKVYHTLSRSEIAMCRQTTRATKHKIAVMHEKLCMKELHDCMSIYHMLPLWVQIFGA